MGAVAITQLRLKYQAAAVGKQSHCTIEGAKDLGGHVAKVPLWQRLKMLSLYLCKLRLQHRKNLAKLL